MNSLKNVYQNLKAETLQNKAFLFLLLMLLVLPLGHAVNSIAVGIFVFAAIISSKKGSFKLELVLILPILIYFLMAISLIWSLDTSETLKALGKVVPIILIPIAFMLMPKLSKSSKQNFLKYYSYGISISSFLFLIKAVVRYFLSGNSDVFFYHELVTKEVNAIHVSVFVAIAFFYFLNRKKKSWADRICMLILSIFILLLSSKNIIVVFILLIVARELYNLFRNKKISYMLLLIIPVGLAIVFFTSNIADRFLIEFQSNEKAATVNQSFNQGQVLNVSVAEAWNTEKFRDNQYFPGTAFRVYQLRIFTELLQEEPIFFTGYGLNATDSKILAKAREHTIFMGNETHEGYHDKNFHNQYIQFFAELGIFGFLLIVVMLGITLFKGLQRRDFVHICFAVLMISLFLTESFLARQRGIIFFTAFYCFFNSGLFGNKKAPLQ